MTPDTVAKKLNERSRCPGPARLNLWDLREGLKDPLAFNFKHWSTFGNSIHFRSNGAPDWMLFAHPSSIEQILQSNQRNYAKPTRFRSPFGLVGGLGILTSEGELWRKQRRLIQPAFNRSHLGVLGALMTSSIVEQVALWERTNLSEVKDLFAEMSTLTFRVIGHALFRDDLTSHREDFCQALEAAVDHISFQMNCLIPVPTWVPIPQNLKFQKARRTLDVVVNEIIERRRKSKPREGDLLALLMASVDTDSGESMSDEQLRDEVMTLLVAGHETVALALTWTLILLAQNPATKSVLLDELQSVLSGREAKMEDLHQLPYNKMVLSEAFRLYPPVWGQPREALDDDEIAGYHVPKGISVTVSQYLTHRLPEFFPDPDSFSPERFLPESEAKLPKFAYFPFGGGGRACIGNHFAMAEAQLALATILQRFDFQFPESLNIPTKAGCTLRPQTGVPVRFVSRGRM